MKKFLLSILCCMLAVFSVQAEEVTLSESSVSGLGKSGGGEGFVQEVSPVTFEFSNAYGASGHIKAYANCAISFSGATITKVVITATSSSYIKTWSASDGAVTVSGSTATWIGSSTAFSLTNTATAQARIKSIVVTYEVAGEGGDETPEPVDVAEPTFTPADGTTFDESLDVTITAEDGLTVYYSTDNNASYTEGNSLNITETTTVYAYTKDAEGNQSDVVSATYTKNVVLEDGTMMITFATATSDNSTAATTTNFVSDYIKEHNFETTLTCSATNNCYVGKSGLKMSSSSKNGSFTLSLGGGYKVTSIIVSAVRFGSDAASITVNGATAQTLSESLAEYTFDVNSEISQIKVDMTQRGYIESIMVVCKEGDDTPVPVAPNAPVLPKSTTFEGSMMVEITGIATDATVYYTTDDSDPATSDTRIEYTEPFEITATTTVKAVAVNEVGESEVAEATYTLVETITLSNCTVAELIEAYASGNNIAEGATVVGYIVGCVDGTAISKAVFGNEVSTNSNILLADDPYETNIGNCIPVQLPSGDVRTALNLVDNSDNYQKKVILTGDVEAYFSVAGLKNTSAYEFVDVSCISFTVKEEGWATLYLGTTARIPSTVEAYTVTTVNEGWVSLTQVTGIIPANTGIIIKADAGDYKLFLGETATADVTGNLLQGTLFNKNIDEEAYVLGNVDGVVGLYKAEMAGGVWLNNANKAYLPASAVPNKSAAFYGFDWNGTTGVENVVVENEVKVIYDLTGRKVEAITEPGIYIINGVKKLVR